ncbi:MAG: hypothetical protein AAFR61_10495 [Bacteroidota bacterium]
MAKQNPPLYGRFAFNSIQSLVERLRELSGFFPESSEFSAYMTTFGGESFYGLDYAEMVSLFDQYKDEVKSLTSAISDKKGMSINVNLRYLKRGGRCDAQYVIVAPTAYQKRRLNGLILGNWEPESPEVKEAYDRLSEVIHIVHQFKVRETIRQEKEKENRLVAHLLSEQKRMDKPPAPKETQKLQVLRDAFHFNQDIGSRPLIELLETLSSLFLQAAPFNIRVITTDGEPYNQIGMKGLRLFMEKRRSSVLKVFMDAATMQGELIDIRLDFGHPPRHHNAEVELTSYRPKQIQATIREMLMQGTGAEISGQTPLVHEMFRFKREEFVLDRVLKLMQTLSSKYLHHESGTAFLSTHSGETYPALSLKQLRGIYAQHQPQVSFLLFGINQSLTGQTFSLMFQFPDEGQEPYGSLSMMWGKDGTHQEVKSLVWDQLKLLPYNKRSAEEEQPAPLQPRTEMTVTPVFQGRKFEIYPLTALILMPLEAYWSESLWVHLQQTLKAVGVDSYKGQALYSENKMEYNWEKLNEVEIVVADLTYKHPDVFYKVGVAHTLGKKIMLITQHARDIPKDFLAFPHIVYDNNIHGLHRLSERLLEWVHRG